MIQTQEQQRFTISEVAPDWHELMIPRALGLCSHPLFALTDNWTRGALHLEDIPHWAFTPQPTPGKLLLISHPAEGRRLIWPDYTVG